MNIFTEVEKVKIYALLKARKEDIKEKIKELESEEQSYNSNNMKSEYNTIKRYFIEELELLEGILKKFKETMSI